MSSTMLTSMPAILLATFSATLSASHDVNLHVGHHVHLYVGHHVGHHDLDALLGLRDADRMEIRKSVTDFPTVVQG